MKKIIALLVVATTIFSCKKEEQNNLPDGLYAAIETAKGTITVQLEYTKAPVTVANFVSLAEGKNDFVSPEFKGKPFYDGLKFHRVEAGFVIQGGDPLGNGSGGPGYAFKDEFTDLSHDKAGTLSMANSGPATNGSQFFITLAPTQNLDGRHTVFGYVVDDNRTEVDGIKAKGGMEAVNSIAVDDVIKSIKIIRKGEAAKKFDAQKVFNDYFAAEKAMLAKKVSYFNEQKSKATQLPSGLQYTILKKGNGNKPANGATVKVDYAGFFEDGSLFDSSIKNVEEGYGKLNKQKEMQNGYQPLPFVIGTKTGLIPGFIEGLEKLNYGDKAILFIPAKLAWGEQGFPPLIKPGTNVVFEIEILEK